MSILDEAIAEVSTAWRKRRRICWILHDWSRWNRVEVNVVPENYTITKQERNCERCGEMQVKSIYQ